MSIREVTIGGGGRILAATLVQSIGQGASMACNAVFFVTIVGLAPGQVGFTYSAGTLAAMGFAIVVGRIADRLGAGNVAIWLALGAACAVASYALVTGLVGFVLVQLLVSSLRMGKQIGENALVGQLVSTRAKFRAYQRSVLNIGMSLGTLSAAFPLYLNDRGAYLAVIFFYASALAVGALLLRGTPGTPRIERKRKNWQALRDIRYVSVGLLAGVMEMRDSILTVALPLWLAGSVDAPRPMVAVLMFLNTAMVILLQVWASRDAETIPGAAMTIRRGGFALALSCVVLGSAMYLSGTSAVIILIGAMICFTLGEMWTAAGSWTLSYELADPRAHGEYQGVFEMTSSVGLLIGPVVATTIALSFGVWGWLAIGVMFVATGLVSERVVVRAGNQLAPAVSKMGS